MIIVLLMKLILAHFSREILSDRDFIFNNLKDKKKCQRRHLKKG